MEEIYDSVPEHLKCPICFEIPKDKVFQCRNGHTFCESCYPKLAKKKCPQCRLILDKTPIRCRALEEMLDSLKLGFPCQFQSVGCELKLDRRDIAEHNLSCKFDFEKFGELINVCGLFGFENCSFSFNRGNIDEALAHFKNVHKMRSKKAVLADFCYPFCLYFENFKNSVNSQRSTVFSPLILDQNWWGHECIYIIVAKYNPFEKALFLTPFYLSRVKKEENNSLAKPVNFFVSEVEGTINPANLLFCEGQTLSESCYFGVPIRKIFKRGKLGKSFTLYVKIRLGENCQRWDFSEISQDRDDSIIYGEADILTPDLLKKRWPALGRPVTSAGIDDWKSEDWRQFRWIASQDFKHCFQHLVPAMTYMTTNIFICRTNINEKWLIGEMQIEKKDKPSLYPTAKFKSPDFIAYRYDQNYYLYENYEVLYLPPNSFEWKTWAEFKNSEPVLIHEEENNLLICGEDNSPFLSHFRSIEKNKKMTPDEYNNVYVLVSKMPEFTK